MSQVKVPQKVFDGLVAVRDIGLMNMLDRPVVARLAGRLGHDEAAQWMRSHPKEYAEAIFRGCEPQEDR